MGWPTSTARLELGATDDPARLVPGDPAAVDSNARMLDRFGTALVSAGNGLRKIDAGGWTGPAAEAFDAAFASEPSRWIGAGEAFTAAAAALRDHARVAVWAQAQAADAIVLWEQAEAETRQAKAEHTEALRQAHQQAVACSLAGVFTPLPEIPFHDPGEAKRETARDLLDRARAQLADSGDQAERVVAHGRDQAPPGPKWWQTALRLGREYATGVYESTWELAKFTWAVTPGGMITDPVGYAQTVAALAQGAAYGVQHPIEFAKTAIDWQTWQTNPARALGHLAPDLVLALATAGTSSTVTAASRGARTAPALPRPANPAPHRPPVSIPDAPPTPIRPDRRWPSFGPAGHPDSAPVPDPREPAPDPREPVPDQHESRPDRREVRPGYVMDKLGRLVPSYSGYVPDGPWWAPEFPDLESDPPSRSPEPEPTAAIEPDTTETPNTANQPGVAGEPDTADAADPAARPDTADEPDADDDADTAGEPDQAADQPAARAEQDSGDMPDPDRHPAAEDEDGPPESWLESHPSSTPTAHRPDTASRPASRSTAGSRAWGEVYHEEPPVIESGFIWG